MKLQEFP